MEQRYFHYTKWEDWQNGMYSADLGHKEMQIGRAEILLSNPERFKKACESVLQKWPNSTAHNLTNTECNRNAWLGQAACCLEYGVPEILTRVAWGRLDNATRLEANRIATLCIKRWEKKHNESKENQLELFGLPSCN